MDTNLLSTLINKNIIRIGTRLTVFRPGLDLAGVLTVKVKDELDIFTILDEDEIIITACSISKERNYKIKASHILKIDGMDPAILAKIFNVNADGSLRPPGKKRGRKPKIRQVA